MAMDTPKHNFILTYGDADGVQLHGPFTSLRQIGGYGCWWQAEHGDDPNWHSVYIADPHARLPVVTPTSDLLDFIKREGWADEYYPPLGEAV
jgi:hypothetical protein